MYSLLDSSHFHGINPVQDKIKDDLVEKEADEVKEDYQTMGYSHTSNEKQKLKQDVKEVVKEEDKKIDNPTFFQNFFDRFYYSINTACLLGYGDIYPATNVTKGIVCIQSLITLILILF